MKQQTATFLAKAREGAKFALQNTRYFFKGLLTDGHPLVQIAYERLLKVETSEKLKVKYAERIADFTVRCLMRKDEWGRDEAVRMMLDVLTSFNARWVGAQAQRIFTDALIASEADLVRVLSHGRINDAGCRKDLLEEGIKSYRRTEEKLKKGEADARTRAIIDACPIDNEGRDSMRGVLFYHLSNYTELKQEEVFKIAEVFVEIGRGLPKQEEWIRHLIRMGDESCGGGTILGVKTRELLENALKENQADGDVGGGSQITKGAGDDYPAIGQERTSRASGNPNIIESCGQRGEGY